MPNPDHVIFSRTLDRMMECGWIDKVAAGQSFASINFTPDGEIARVMLKRIIASLEDDGDAFFTAHFPAFLQVIRGTTEA